MITLTMTEILRACREHYDAGKLQPQVTLPSSMTWCLYSGPCAIGAALPEEVRKDLDSIDDDTSLWRLVSLGLLHVDHVEDACTLQDAHDAWFSASGNEAQFVATLKSLERRYGLA